MKRNHLKHHKIAIEVDEQPKSIQIPPRSWSSVFNVAKAEDKGVGIKLAIWIFNSLNNSALVRAFTLGIIQVVKSRPTLVRKTGTGDMNVLGSQWKIPVVTYGPGDPHEAHTIDEKVSIEEYLKGIEILKATLQHLKRLHDKKLQ